MNWDGSDTTHSRLGGNPEGCGALSRDALELAAIARTEPDLKLEQGVEAHLFLCARCRAAVDAFSADNALLGEFAVVKPRVATRLEAALQAEAAQPSGPIPGYQLLGEIHRGGQGAVYRAEQIATRRACAVKMLLGGRFAGEREMVRFEREIAVVARLRHPSIVTLYESGLSREGEPWFAMELVEGERLDRYVAARSMPPREIARLLRTVAEAVAYAHRRGIIHRDLKPGNILVDADGMPRVLDFGLARADEVDGADMPSASRTLAGEFLGTFAYAAPEQLKGDPAAIDSRCDLYALGTVLYECLTGRKPFEGARSIGELVQQKTETVPPRPSVLRTGVDRDLDVIVLRLLAPDPARRYETADALVEDLERFLDGRPILAREDSVSYVVVKTLRRHWVISSAVGLLLCTIVGATIALAVAYAHAERQRVRSERTLASFRDAVGSVNPESGAGSAQLTVEQFLELIEQNAAQELASEPAVLAGVLDTVGIVHLGFEDAARAESALESALATRRELRARGECTDAEVAESLHNMGRVLILQGRLGEAETSYREAMALRVAALGADDPRSMLTTRHLASCLRRQKRLPEARAMFDELERRALAIEGYSALELAAIRNGNAFVASEEGQHEAALRAFQDALAAIRGELPPDDYRIGRSLFNIAVEEEKLGRVEDARRHGEQALEILRRRKGGDAATVQRVEQLLGSSSGSCRTSQAQTSLRAGSPARVPPWGLRRCPAGGTPG
ncbi:MAG: serine/threonine-protein kinase [Planctomycetaceae bacterium]|nr:serine/threonine-protein kinase [Planctomycetaceae bacterium]